MNLLKRRKTIDLQYTVPKRPAPISLSRKMRSVIVSLHYVIPIIMKQSNPKSVSLEDYIYDEIFSVLYFSLLDTNIEIP